MYIYEHIYVRVHAEILKVFYILTKISVTTYFRNTLSS